MGGCKMFIKQNYVINEDVMCMSGLYDRNGKLCTFVMETKQNLIVDQSPLEILEYSIRQMGFDLKGAINASGWLLGQTMMLPIIVNHIHEIVLFPTLSPKHVSNMWFNPNHINLTNSCSAKTIVHFSNNKTVIVAKKLKSFNHRMQMAMQLKKLIIEAGKTPPRFFPDA